jgi:hypothetical protein
MQSSEFYAAWEWKMSVLKFPCNPSPQDRSDIEVAVKKLNALKASIRDLQEILVADSYFLAQRLISECEIKEIRCGETGQFEVRLCRR